MHAMRRVVVSLVLVLVCATAHAEKSRTLAQGLSGGGAGVSGVIVLTGFLTAPDGEAFNTPVLFTGLGMLFVTPSLGHFYAGQYLTWGMGIRAVATGLAIYTLEAQTKIVTCDDPSRAQCEVFNETAYALLGISAIAFIGGVWWDTLDAGDAADRYNKSHAVTVQPTVQASAHGFTAGLSGTF